MLVKSMSRKQAQRNAFRTLVQYMDRDGVGDSITHNLVAVKEKKRMILEFENNAALLPVRSNGNQLYHEILSFSTKEAAVPVGAMVELAEEYLRLRAPAQMAYMRIHLTKNPHVHLCISAGDLLGKRVSLSKAKFDSIKKKLEGIQLERFPELCESLVQGREKPALWKSRMEQEATRRSKSKDRKPWKASKRDLATMATKQAFTAPTRKTCLSILHRHGFSLYERGGKIVGVQDTNGRKYRLKTLAVDEHFRLALKKWKIQEKEKRLRPHGLEPSLGMRR